MAQRASWRYGISILSAMRRPGQRHASMCSILQFGAQLRARTRMR